MESFQGLLQPAPKKSPLGRIVRTVAELEQIKEEARLTGFAEGKDAGYQVGFAQGLADGKETGHRLAYEDAATEKKAELDGLRAEFQRIYNQVDAAMREWFERSEPGLAQVGALVAARILARELKVTPDSILAMAKEAVSEVTHATSARIRVNPFDSPVLEEHRAEIMSASGSLRDFEIVEDSSIAGGCVIETEGGVVDALIDSKVAVVLEAIRRAR